MESFRDTAIRVPAMVWDRRQDVAKLTLSFAGRIWHRREVGDDIVLGYNATGRLAKVVILGASTILPEGAGEREALEAVTAALLRRARIRQADLDVLRSAIDRAR